MKYFFSLLLAAVFIGLVLFAAFFWMLKWSFADSLNVGFAGAIGGLAAEGVRFLRSGKQNIK